MKSMFGEVDKTLKGGYASEFPAFYNRNHTEDLKETIREMQNRLDMGLVPSESVPDHKDQIRELEKKLTGIMDAVPNLNEAERDKLNKVRKWLGIEIRKWLFSDSDMRTGKADAHEEARRMSEPIIKVEDKDHASVLQACGVENFHGIGMITRNQAEKAWKIVSKVLEEPSNVEILRKT